MGETKISFNEKQECIIFCNSESIKLLSLENGTLIHCQENPFTDVPFLYPWGCYRWIDLQPYYYSYQII